jgi:hypothetical protein
MPSPLDTILDLVKRKVSQQQRGGSGGILGQITDMLGSRNAKKPGQHSVRPASEDPYGDPADQGGSRAAGHKVKPASEDPYGDPADQK